MSTEWKRIAATGAISLVGLVAIAGCGGDDDGGSDDTVSADEYVSSVCLAINDMAGVLEGSQTELQDALSGDPEQGKDLLVGFLSDAADTVGGVREDLEAAGVPDVDSGEEIADALPAAFGELETVMADAATEAEDIPTDDPAAFAEAAQGVGSTIQEAGTQIGESLDELATSEELETAAAESEDCQSLGGA